MLQCFLGVLLVQLGALLRLRPRRGDFQRVQGTTRVAARVAHDVVESMDVTWLEGLDPAQFESLNTPADLERFRVALSAQR